MRILLLEDDTILSNIIIEHLSKHHNVTHFEDGEESLHAIENDKFDLLILDIQVPSLSGIEVVKNLRFFKNTTPTILITAYQDTSFLKEGFESGCDDYIKKPFALEELDVRIKNLSKRFSIEEEIALHLDNGVTFFPAKNQIEVDDKVYTIANKECEVLKYLCTHPKRVIPSDELIQNIWGYESMPSDATIRVYIKNLRQILGKDKIQTIRGSGYCFV